MRKKIYSHRPAAPDALVGRVDPKTGKVYESRFGPDKYMGRVELESGKVVTVQGVELSFYPPTIVVPGSKDGARLAQLAASQASVR